MLKIGVFADKGMGRWLVQTFEPINKDSEITLFIPYNNKHDHSLWRLNKHILNNNHEIWLSIKNLRTYIKRLKNAEFNNHVEFYPFSLIEHFSSNKYDIIITKAYRSLYTLSTLKKRFGFKLVYRYPYALPYTQIFNKRFEFSRRMSFKKIDHFICISETAKNNLMFEGYDASKIDVIKNSVDLSVFKPRNKDIDLMKDLGIKNNEKIVIFVGKLTSWKNPFTILYALKLVAEKKINVKVILVGQGAQKTNLIKTAKLLGIYNRVIFTGFIENYKLNKYYNISDISIMSTVTSTTINEQFPYSLVESMASGVPVVATNSGGMPELVGKIGKLYPQGNYNELANIIIDILSQEDNEITLLRQQTRKHAELMFNNKNNSKLLLDILRKISNK